MNIDKRKNHYLILDVETIGLVTPLVYDIGYLITDKQGNILLERSFLVKEIFYNTKLMATAYYSEKIPLYLEQITKGEIKVLPFEEIQVIINQDISNYNCQFIGAYNYAFDKRALKFTNKELSDKPNMLNYQLQEFCIWGMACQYLYSSVKFIEFCISNNYFTDKNNMLTNAEIGYRFITNDTNFIEEHMGIQDCRIEKEIFIQCLKKARLTKKDLKVIGNAWRIPNDYKKQLENKNKKEMGNI